MKKVILISSVLIFGLSTKLFASTGSANDGLVFVLALVGFLLIIAGLLKAIDYLGKNGRQIIHPSKALLRKTVAKFLNYVKKAKSNYFDFSYLKSNIFTGH